MLKRLLMLLLLLLPVPAAAETLEGNWTFSIDETAIFQFRVERDEDGWHGTWLRPTSFASNGVIFSEVTGPPVDVAATKVREIGDMLELTFRDLRPGAVPDIFLLHLLPEGIADAIYAETGFAPFQLVRDEQGKGIGPWREGVIYQRPGLDPAAAGQQVQFSSGQSALVSRLEELITGEEAPPEPLPEPEPEPPSEPQPEPSSRQPAMIGR
jgi:hypothetical protein